MFYLISVGLSIRQITLEAFDTMRKCDELYFDTYTSIYANTLQKLEQIAGKNIVPLGRLEIEGLFFEKLKAAKEKNIGLIVVGNALFATTHIQLLIDCAELGVPYKFIPGVSLTSYLGLTGLSTYRFGETVSIVIPEEHYSPKSFYEKIARNYKNNLHSLCLLDIKDGKPVTVASALSRLLEIEKRRKRKLIKDATIIVICKAGTDEEIVIAGKASELAEKNLGTPASLIICAELSENERRAIKALYMQKV